MQKTQDIACINLYISNAFPNIIQKMGYFKVHLQQIYNHCINKCIDCI